MVDSKKRKQWLWFFGLIAAFIVLLLGLYVRMISVRSSAFEAVSEERISPVRVQETLSTEVWRTTSFLARVEGGQTLDIIADVGGWVVEKKVVLGQEVNKGDALIVLEDPRRVLRLKESEARLKSARADLSELKRKYDQSLTLVEKGIIARDTLDSLSNQVASESANVDSLEASYGLMKWDVDNLTVPSPISGKIVEVLPDVGQEVTAGQLVVKMVSTKRKRVVAGVEPRWARIIKPGMKVDLSTKLNGRLEETEGRIIGVSPNIDSLSGTYRVEAELINNEYNWLPGEIVNMEIPTELLTEVLIVPRTAVLSDSENLFIFIYQDGKAVKIPVSVEWINDREGTISADLIPDGSSIIVEGHVGLAGGQLVRVTK
ncbi:MAG: efflux RND transporter periplasmic adaptor subunit [Candidatus Dadabacteria bacterium]|nr:efflux RND transporter periplasmic adaptor subunit [Candidatus Dadabacteria bacterium]